jgi:hypothetical protein
MTPPACLPMTDSAPYTVRECQGYWRVTREGEDLREFDFPSLAEAQSIAAMLNEIRCIRIASILAMPSIPPLPPNPQ